MPKNGIIWIDYVTTSLWRHCKWWLERSTIPKWPDLSFFQMDWWLPLQRKWGRQHGRVGGTGWNIRHKSEDVQNTWVMIFSFYIFHVWRHASGVYQPRLAMPLAAPIDHATGGSSSGWQGASIDPVTRLFKPGPHGFSWLCSDWFLRIEHQVVVPVVLVIILYWFLLVSVCFFVFFPTSPKWNAPSLPDVGFGWFRHQRFLVDDEHYPLVIATSTVCGLENHHVWKR